MHRFGSDDYEPGKFVYPVNVAVSADKHIFVADDYFRKRVRKFTFSSSLKAVYAATNVKEVAVHSTSGKVFCTNCTDRNVTQY